MRDPYSIIKPPGLVWPTRELGGLGLGCCCGEDTNEYGICNLLNAPPKLWKVEVNSSGVIFFIGQYEGSGYNCEWTRVCPYTPWMKISVSSSAITIYERDGFLWSAIGTATLTSSLQNMVTSNDIFTISAVYSGDCLHGTGQSGVTLVATVSGVSISNNCGYTDASAYNGTHVLGALEDCDVSCSSSANCTGFCCVTISGPGCDSGTAFLDIEASITRDPTSYKLQLTPDIIYCVASGGSEGAVCKGGDSENTPTTLSQGYLTGGESLPSYSLSGSNYNGYSISSCNIQFSFTS